VACAACVVTATAGNASWGWLDFPSSTIRNVAGLAGFSDLDPTLYRPERVRKITKLEEEIDRLQRSEEAIVVAIVARAIASAVARNNARVDPV
jgi:hypothetical protein